MSSDITPADAPGDEEVRPAGPSGRSTAPAPGPGLPKIFGIGLSRTGTTSLTAALDLLGFPTVHYPTRFSQIEAHAAATDITVALVFKKLDRLYPGSCFILTQRALEPWLESCASLWKKNAEVFERNPMVMEVEKRVYGGAGFDRHLYGAARERLLAVVEAHFRDRSDDLLCLDLFEDADPWAALCGFLKVAHPDCPFPHRNHSAAVDHILSRLLKTLNDVGEVARLTHIGEAYLLTLTTDGTGGEPATPVLLAGGFEELRILKRCCASLGSGQVAAILDLDPRRLETFLEEQAATRQSS